MFTVESCHEDGTLGCGRMIGFDEFRDEEETIMK
jgi:hypothetical protein